MSMNPSLVELKQNKPGFNRFIGSWVIKGEENIVVDVGPSNSINQLIAALAAMEVNRVDWVLLTHIHIDHAGGLARFLTHFPMARAVCHAKGINHLVDPSRLWAGSKKTLGDLSDHYGSIGPVRRESLVPHTGAKTRGLEIIETPGHAQHHLSFVYQHHLFAGEAGGIHLTVGDLEYARPATPPVFFLKEFLGSIDRLLAHETMPICYGHFGRAESSHSLLEKHKDQLILWEGVIKQEMSSGENNLVERCLDKLLEKDPALLAFARMGKEDQDRERFFIRNSVRGYLGFLSSPAS
jgi:glyoxylase-like metal-dependent hydrolase (beta-lactamase superfamily II)